MKERTEMMFRDWDLGTDVTGQGGRAGEGKGRRRSPEDPGWNPSSAPHPADVPVESRAFSKLSLPHVRKCLHI